MTADAYQQNINYLIELLDEVNGFQKKLAAARTDIERLDAMEKVVAYSASLSHLASWTMHQIRHPRAD